MNQIIQTQLKKDGFTIEDKGSYEVKTPLYNLTLINREKEHPIYYEFPIELGKRVKPIVKLPFKLGKLVYETGMEVIK